MNNQGIKSVLGKKGEAKPLIKFSIIDGSEVLRFQHNLNLLKLKFEPVP